jgi:hypothetical protein
VQVKDQDGKWLVLRITPYRTLDNRIDGAVLTILDRHAFEGLSTVKSGGTARKQATKKSPTRRK